MSNTLLQHIQKINAAATAWATAEPGRWSAHITEDLNHWEGYGITTPEQFDHYMLVNDVYEMHKSVFGSKPNWSKLRAMTDEQLQEKIKVLSKMSLSAN